MNLAYHTASWFNNILSCVSAQVALPRLEKVYVHRHRLQDWPCEQRIFNATYIMKAFLIFLFGFAC